MIIIQNKCLRRTDVPSHGRKYSLESENHQVGEDLSISMCEWERAPSRTYKNKTPPKVTQASQTHPFKKVTKTGAYGFLTLPNAASTEHCTDPTGVSLNKST